MAYALDTNIFIYAHMAQFSEHEKARSFLEKLFKRPDPFYIGWQVYYEYMRLVTHPRILNTPLSLKQAIQDMQPYLKDPRCRMLTETEIHADIFQEIVKKLPQAKGNFVHDCHYAALLKEHAIEEIVTADLDFKKFDFLKVINPLV